MSSWESGQAALVDGDLEKALPLLEEAAIEAETMPEGSDEKTERLTLLASVLARGGEVEQAESVFARALKERLESHGMDETVASTLYLMAEMYRYDPMRLLDAAGLLAVASEILERMEVKNELTFQVEYAYAVVLSRLMNTEGALLHLEKAWPLIPKGSPLLFNMLSLAASLGMGAREYDFASQVFAKTASLQEPGPEQNATLASLADLQLVQGLYGEALETSNRGLANDPKDGKLLRRRGVASSRLGRPEDARESLLQARQAAGFRNDQAELTMILGDVEARQQRWEQAVARYEEARGMVKGDRILRAHVRLSLGKAYLQLGRQEEARRNFAAAAYLRKRMERPPYLLVAEALYHLGKIYIQRGEFLRAELRLFAGLNMLEADVTPFEILSRPEQETTTELLELLPVALSEAMEKQERFDHAASILEPLVIHKGGPLENIDRLASLYERAGMSDRAEFWVKVAADLRSQA